MPLSDVSSFWISRLRERFFSHFWLKAFVIPIFITAFFVLYFFLQNHPRAAVTTVPFLALDRWIGFQPLAIVPYVSLWFYVLIVACFVKGPRELLLYSFAVAALTIVGFGVFLLWPTATPPFRVDLSQHPSFQFLKRIDSSGNACPSLHVAFAVFSCVWIDRLSRHCAVPTSIRFASALWCIAIVYSTIATKQHVAIDALAGGVLGVAVAFLNPWTETSQTATPSPQAD